MSVLEIGLVLPMLEEPQSGEKPPRATIKTFAQRAEVIGFDTIWSPDELLWRVPSRPGARGWWESVSTAGAVAAITSKIGIGTWVLSALHRNPGLTVKIAETLDEISGGRFLLGLGAGHAGDQGATFGYPPDKMISRYADALEIIVPALRGEIVSWDGPFHNAHTLEIRPRGPRPGLIPLMLAGHGPRTMRLAARHADIWSGYATESSLHKWFEPMLNGLEEACHEVGRDPNTLGRSVGIFVEPTDDHSADAADLGVPITGTPSQIAETISRFGEMGVTRVELMLWPTTKPASTPSNRCSVSSSGNGAVRQPNAKHVREIFVPQPTGNLARFIMTTAWHNLSPHEVLDHLGSDQRHGLTGAEVETRRERYGENRIQEVRAARWYEVLARQFTDVLILILLAAAVISFAVGEVADAITILVIVVLNGALGFVQEWKAEQALDALRNMLSPTCTVIRDGAKIEIDRTELVPGDIVALEIGDQVPADLRLIESLNVKIDESALTGESASVHKDTSPVDGDTPLAERSSMAWMGTNVTNGRARGVVVGTGMSTEFGRIAELTQSLGQDPTPLQRKLGVLGKQLGVISIAISAAVAAAGILLGKPLLEMFLTGVSLAVAVVPEGLPAVVTITLALGIRAMVKRHALLRRLQAAEALGSATVICTDKTGTLTKNEMTVTRVWLPAGGIDVTGVGYDPAGGFRANDERLDYSSRADLLTLLEIGLVCNHAQITRTDMGWRQLGEPTEAALIVAAYKAWLAPDRDDVGVTEFSFNSTRKRMTVVERRPEGLVAFTKGAPEVILDRSTRILDGDSERSITDTDRAAFAEAYRSLAGRGLRTLALARRTLPDRVELDEDAVENDLTLVGIVGIIDPPRPEVLGAIALARRAGVRPIMITGDAGETAAAIAAQLDLHVDRVVTGTELEATLDEDLDALLEQDVLFARTTPEHKLRIVTHLQGQGNIVAMTGDGVNDAPALKQADIGVAMGLRGTDVAKAASDMVLTDDNFASIVGAIEEGRRQYDNIQKFVRYLLSSNTGEVVAVFINILLGGPLILLPVQILWMNLVTDGMTAVALGLEPGSKDLMEQPPRGAREPILNRYGAALLLALGGYIGLGALWLFHHYLADLGRSPEAIATAQTVAFTGIILLEKMNVFNFRSLRQSLHRIGFWTNPWVLGAWILTVSLQVAAVYTPFLQNLLHTVPLHWQDWLLMFAVAVPIFLIVEGTKLLRSRR